MNRKKRILIQGEFSQLATGFATYMYYILPRLYATGKYEIFEQASYIDKNNPLINSVPWEVIPNLPDPSNPEEIKKYASNKLNQFGAWKFEETCLKVQPDIVITITDPWMNSFIHKSPYRKHFHFIYMPTVDGYPQKQEWVDEYASTDTLLTYSYYGKSVLEYQTLGKIKVRGVASPGTDTKVFKPLENKSKLRQDLGIRPDAFLINTVMRNQPRKLYPELMKAFLKFLDICKEKGNHDLANRSYMHFHTSHPDVGWDLPEELRDHKLSHKILFTYMCDKCGAIYLSYFNGELHHCRQCKNLSARFPNTAAGVSREALAAIMGLSDVFVQYSICLAKGEEILTESGWKPIESTKVGELVWTHEGRWQKVIDSFKNPLLNRDMYKISLDADYDTLTCTEDHLIYGLFKEDIKQEKIRKWCGQQIYLGKDLPDPQMLPASLIQDGDLIATIIDDKVEDIQKIDLAEFAPSNAIISDDLIDIPKGDCYPRYINIDEDFCKFIGLYVADGSSSSNRMLRITQSNLELEQIQFSKNIFDKISNKESSVRSYSDRAAKDITLHSCLHYNALKSWCGSGKDKQLPNWYQYLPLNKQLAMLQGLFMGDGYMGNKRSIIRQVSIYTTISKNLSSQIKNILQRNRMYYNVRIDDKKKSSLKDGRNRQPQFRFEITGNIAKGEFESSKIRNNVRSLYYKNLFYRQVSSITNPQYNDDVFCIEVENDHSFTTKIGITHNCEGFGMSMNDAKACGVPVMAVDWSAMCEQAHNAGGIPIKVRRTFQEPINATSQYRSLPDNDDLSQKLYDYAVSPQEYKDKMSAESRACAVNTYDWDLVAKHWENLLDSIEIKDPSETWLSKPNIIQPDLNFPNISSNEQFVSLCYEKILKDPNGIYSYNAQHLIEMLNVGYEIGMTESGETVKNMIDKNKVANMFIHMVQHKNNLESYRYETLVNGRSMTKERKFVEV